MSQFKELVGSSLWIIFYTSLCVSFKRRIVDPSEVGYCVINCIYMCNTVCYFCDIICGDYLLLEKLNSTYLFRPISAPGALRFFIKLWLCELESDVSKYIDNNNTGSDRAQRVIRMYYDFDSSTKYLYYLPIYFQCYYRGLRFNIHVCIKF